MILSLDRAALRKSVLLYSAAVAGTAAAGVGVLWAVIVGVLDRHQFVLAVCGIVLVALAAWLLPLGIVNTATLAGKRPLLEVIDVNGVRSLRHGQFGERFYRRPVIPVVGNEVHLAWLPSDPRAPRDVRTFHLISGDGRLVFAMIIDPDEFFRSVESYLAEQGVNCVRVS